jgi:hypothetical protein
MTLGAEWMFRQEFLRSYQVVAYAGLRAEGSYTVIPFIGTVGPSPHRLGI